MARPHMPDVVLVLGVAAVMAGNAALTGTGPLGYLLLGASALVLYAQRRAPRTVLVITTACALGYVLLDGPELVAGLPALITIFSVVKSGHNPLALIATAVLEAGMVGAGLLHGLPLVPAVKGALAVAGWFVASAVMGVVFQQIEQRAVEAERTREEAALRRAGEERLRIARELHDSLTHSISIIKVQAGVAVHLARKRGEEPPPALLAIQEAGSEAMRELRATLEVLRDDADPPTGILDRLPDLVDRACAAGQPTTLKIDGRPRTLPGEVEQAAYRIVQEALTNVTRHAGPASATVLVGYAAHGLVVQVDDDGRGGVSADPPGVGLTGMRERVAALGGELVTGPRPEGGFSVRADLPVRVS
ncbi:sensor histidine kinase [Nonomuraea sp. NPDC000554]|uniref:sensor histidine kinase n=1 Tax=Nonomuraea sp. NPDC000554 TaxID=3154259 RepID=UPI0033222728